MPIQPYRVWNKGEPKAPRSARSKLHETSGACFNVSGAKMDQFAQQLEDATLFLEQHGVWLTELSRDPWKMSA